MESCKVIKRLVINTQYYIKENLISQLKQLLETIDIDKTTGETGTRKLMENLTQQIVQHTKDLVEKKGTMIELLKNITPIL